MTGYALEILPRLNPNRSVALMAELRVLGPTGRSAKSTVRVKPGQTVRVTGVTDSPDPQIQETVRQGILPEKKVAHTALYVEAMATETQPKP